MTSPQPIGYSLPTSRAFEGMKRVLFRPFDIGKWFVLGFSAWLATLLEGGGSGGSGNYGSSGGQNGGNANEAFREAGRWIEDNIELVIGIGVVLFLFVVALVVVLLWVSSRGKFMFLDNVIHNRARVKIPWSEFRTLGNSLFRWRLVFGVVAFGVMVPILGVTAAIAIGIGEGGAILIPLILGGGLLLVVAVLFGYIGLLLEDFVIPIMYRDSLLTNDAWRRFLVIHRSALGKFVLYALWKILLSLGVGICIVVLGLVTCCIGFLVMAIPYIGAVLLLPVTVFFRFLGPEFLKQFGSDYDLLPPAPPAAPAPAVVA